MQIANDETNWAQKYRPQRLEDMVLPPAIFKQLAKVRDQQLGLHLLLHGTAGTGKTTAAGLINKQGNYYLNCSLDSSVYVIDKIEKTCSAGIIGDGLRIVILDEAEQLTAKAQGALRGLIEQLSASNQFVFTVNDKSKLIDPLHSRLHAINFSHLKGDVNLMQEMVNRVMLILEAENALMDRSIVETVVRESYPDMRRVLTRLQAELLLN